MKFTDNKISSNFLKNGYVKLPALDLKALNSIKKLVIAKAKLKSKKKLIKNEKSFLEDYHNIINYDLLNNYRVKIIKDINNKKIRENYLKISKRYLEILVGNELAIQKNINLSIQLPKDKSSILPIHADTWSGNSPYEVVVWVPLVNCKKTQSMFILEKKYLNSIQRNLTDNRYENSNKFFKSIKKKLKWININYGEILIFDQTIPHGNIENIEKETRWSLNCRFKSLLSPYGTKKLGEYFVPVNVKPITKIGLDYVSPFKK